MYLWRSNFLNHWLFASVLIATTGYSQKPNLIKVDSAWSSNSVNVTVFRKNSLVTWRDTQYIAFYDRFKHVVLGKRKIGSAQWLLKQTGYTGNTEDAHNSISIMVDGDGFLHLSWDHHNTKLRYCKSVSPGSLDLSPELPMTGQDESRVSYPEFFRIKNGDVLFFYRNGQSGGGNLIIKKYELKTKKWAALQNNLIDGEGIRNAYWQAYTDNRGTIHISWVWRETPNVASNHDLCYARSRDGGKSWENSMGEEYTLPITAATAEYAAIIPQQSELINQTSMSADRNGKPFIATYWRDADSKVPQYRIVYKTRNEWKILSLSFRTAPFTLSGIGTKRIPIARPQIVVKKRGRNASVLMIFRDEERNSCVSYVKISRIKKGKWIIKDLTQSEVGSWEPSYDTELWKDKEILNLFVLKVDQADAEGKSDLAAEIVQVLEWKPQF